MVGIFEMVVDCWEDCDLNPFETSGIIAERMLLWRSECNKKIRVVDERLSSVDSSVLVITLNIDRWEFEKFT